MAEPGRLESVASHRITRLIVALGIGIGLAVYAFRFATDPQIAEQREGEEAAVQAARAILRTYVAADGPVEIADPLAPNRALGKAFIYPQGDGFEISGYYRRGEGDTWHPFLMTLNGGNRLVSLSVRDTDARLQRRAGSDPRLDVRPE